MAHNDDTHVAYVKEAGIDFLITGVNEEFLDRCDKAGVGVISTNYNLPCYVMTGDTTAWQTFDYGTYKDHDCLWGDNLMDEPFDSMFNELGQTVAHYYKNAPGKIPLINLSPSTPVITNSESQTPLPSLQMSLIISHSVRTTLYL